MAVHRLEPIRSATIRPADQSAGGDSGDPIPDKHGRSEMSDNTDFGTFGRFAETAVSEMPEEMRQAYDYTLKLPGPDKIWLANPRLSPTIDARCEALFASGLQRSDAPTAEMVAMPSKALCGGSASMAASAGWLKSSATTRRGRRAHALDPSVRRRGARRAADGGSCWPRQQQRRNREQSGEHSLRCRGRATTGSTLLQAYEIPVRHGPTVGKPPAPGRHEPHDYPPSRSAGTSGHAAARVLLLASGRSEQAWWEICSLRLLVAAIAGGLFGVLPRSAAGMTGCVTCLTK